MDAPTVYSVCNYATTHPSLLCVHEIMCASPHTLSELGDFCRFSICAWTVAFSNQMNVYPVAIHVQLLIRSQTSLRFNEVL